VRVLFVANTLPSTDISGVGEQAIQLAAGLESLGHRVRILGRGKGGAVGPKLLFPFAVLPPFLRALREFRPHVIQVHESDGALAALMVKTLTGTVDPPPTLVALQQVSYLEEIRAVRQLQAGGQILGTPGFSEWRFRWLKAPVQVAFGALTAWLADVLLAPSQQTAREIERDYQVAGVGVLPNVTGSRSTLDPDAKSEHGKAYLLFVGRLRIRKGVEVLLYAMRRLLDREIAPRLLIVGSGEHGARLRKVVAKLGLESCVEFLGSCPPERIPQIMAHARALVVPSIYEGMPLVILEAMAAGKPVVASRVSGIPEVVEDGETGWLVPPENIDALVEVLTEIGEKPTEAKRRGRCGRERVEALATPAKAAGRWSELVVGHAAQGEN